MSAADQPAGMARLQTRLRAHLEVIYGEQAQDLVGPIIEAMRYEDDIEEPAPYQNYWSEADCWMITYATSIHEEGNPGLKTLQAFCDRYLSDTVNGLAHTAVLSVQLRRRFCRHRLRYVRGRNGRELG